VKECKILLSNILLKDNVVCGGYFNLGSFFFF
jgi:hypothetical protein